MLTTFNTRHVFRLFTILLLLLLLCVFTIAPSVVDAVKVNPICENLREGSLDLSFLFVLLGICLLMIHILHKFKVHWLPESLAVVVFGILISLVCKYMINYNMDAVTMMDPDLFFQLLLPAIIFDASFTLKKEYFFENIGTISLIAFVGTTISTIVVACGMYVCGQLGIHSKISLLGCLMFGSYISSVDPVATLAIFNSVKVNPTLHYLVFGESLVNDAIAVTLYVTFEGFVEGNTGTTAAIIGMAVWTFCLNTIISFVFASVIGFASALFFKYVDMSHNPILEIGLFGIFAYVPYLIALPFMSGIVCILISGIIMSYYTAPNLSPVSQDTIHSLSKTLALVGETFVFLYMGMAVFSFNNLAWDWVLIVGSIVLCIVGRFLNVVPLVAIANSYREEKVHPREQTIMWFSGLRGAVSFALAIGGLKHGVEGQLLFTTTLATVLFTIFVLGGGTYPLLRLLKIKLKSSDKQRMKQSVSFYENLAIKVNENYFRRWFIKKDILDKFSNENPMADDTKESEETIDLPNIRFLTGDTEININIDSPNVVDTPKLEENKLKPIIISDPEARRSVDRPRVSFDFDRVTQMQ